jgi:hypothetical protein
VDVLPELLISQEPKEDDSVDLDGAHRNLERMLGFVTMADNKALIALSFQGAAIAGLAVMAEPVRIAIESPAYPWRKWVLIVLVVLFLACFFVSIAKLLQTIAPRVVPPASEFDPSHLFFFGAVAKMHPDEFAARLRQVRPDELHDGIAKVAHINAILAMRKFANLRVAYLCLGLEMMFFICTAFLIVL